MVLASLDEQVAALDRGRGFVRARARTVAAQGADAPRWLNDLATAGVDGLREGQSARSLILSPTGRIRADIHVVRTSDGFLLVQSLDQPEPVDAILAPYVLSSAVELEGVDAAPVLLPRGDGWGVALEPAAGAPEVGPEAAEAWRIEAGIATFPPDLDADSLPAEAGLDVPPVTDTAKGCFLGQESVARVRNLGHPTRVVVRLRADPLVPAGTAVVSGGTHAGTVTSAAAAPGGRGSVLLARVRWEARGSALRTADGVPLEPA